MLKFGSKTDVNVSCKCTVRLLEDTEVIECEFQPQHKGKHLLDQVCQQLNLIEKDYFGLRYVDSARQRHWLDLTKSIAKQVKYMDPILFSFRVKFYPPDPFRLKEEITRYQVYLQLRRDLLHGRLYCTNSEAALLAAYIVQADLGDYNPQEHEGNYIQELRLLLKQTPQIEEKIMELHQSHLMGQLPADVETSFLRRACTLDTYGVDPHPVKDHRGTQLYLGINHLGILTFQGSRKTHHFRWPEIHKINYEGKMFIVHLTYNEKKHTVGFKCPTGAACRHVWRCAIEQMLFFTLPSGSEVPTVSGGSFFSWGTKFKYSGRTEREILEEVGPLRQDEPAINRVGSLRRKAASVPATPSTPVDMADIRYSSLPRSNHSVPDSRLDGGPSLLVVNGDGSYCLDGNIPLLETVTEDQEVHARAQRNQGEIEDCRNVENLLGQERKPLFAENQMNDGLEDIQEEDEEEEQEELRQLQELQREQNTASHLRVHMKSISSCVDGQDLSVDERSKIRNGNVTRLADDISQSFSTENGARDADTLDAGASEFSEYYFRDSFEHSSSESQLVEAGQGRSHRSSRSQTPVARGRTGSKLSLNSGAIVPMQANTSDLLSHPPATPIRRVQLRASYLFPALALSALLLAIFATVVLESSEDGPFSVINKLPEVAAVRSLYYEPIKEYLRKRLGALVSP